MTAGRKGPVKGKIQREEKTVIKDKASMIIKDKRGASMIFVLGIMLFLMAIGSSVMAAASSNTGFVTGQKEHSKAVILDDAIHKNIMYSLQHDTGDEQLLSRQLAEAIYRANDPDLSASYSPGGLCDITIDSVGLSNGVDLKSGGVQVKSITVSFPRQDVDIIPATPAKFVDVTTENEFGQEIVTGEVFDAERIPRKATVNALAKVRVEVLAKGRTTASCATYEYTGGELSDDPLGIYKDMKESEIPVLQMAFETGGYGEWRLIKLEKADSVYEGD